MTDFRRQMVMLLPRLRAFAHALARTGHAADDLVQATCERALRAAESWTPGTRFDSWMFRIMQNQWIDMKRRERPQVAIDEPETGLQLTGDDGERITEARLTLASVREFILDLPEEQRAILVLICVEEQSYRETAEILEIPMGTVMSRLARARKTLIERMQESGPGENRTSGAAT